MWRFGDYVADPARRELRRGDELVHPEPQAFDLLVRLIEGRDRVVPTIELLDAMVVSEANLLTRIKEVRRAVGDDGTRQHTIRNVRGRGYRFVADVAPVTDPDSGLLGRDAELAAARAALARARVVTLVGPGGVGKSALAREVAGDAPVVELAALDPDADVLAAAARVLDVVLDPARVGDAIRSMARLDALVVLDNCEHVADAVASAVERLVEVPGGAVRVLATSRVPLGVAGEVLVELRPLAPADARALFDARARAALQTWDGGDGATVDRLLADLDRLPLTIEMAAARLRTMTLEDLARVLGDPGGRLLVTHRSPTPRHRSLESVTRWSADLLSPELRRRFTELAVFAGSVGAADAAAVVGATPIELADLADRSLLVADVGGPETRYSMLATVHAVASQWLERSGTADAVRRRHAEHVAGALAEVDELVRGPREAEGRRRFDALVDEARAAHRWARRHAPDLAADLSASLFRVAYANLWNEPAEWSLALGDRPGAALVVAGAAAHRGDLAEARRGCEAVLAASRGHLAAKAYELLVDVATYEGDLPRARHAAEALGRLGEELDDLHLRVYSAVNVALVGTYAGDPSGALAALDAAPRDGLAPSDAAWLAYARGEALGLAGEPGAVEAYREAVEVGRGIGHRFVVSVAQVSLASELGRRGDVAEAFDSYGEALADFVRHGNTTHAVTAVRNLVGLLERVGDDRGAVRLAGAVAGGGGAAVPTYGIEAERVRAGLAALRGRVGDERFDRWWAEGVAASDDVVRVAVEVVEAHRGYGRPHDEGRYPDRA